MLEVVGFTLIDNGRVVRRRLCCDRLKSLVNFSYFYASETDFVAVILVVRGLSAARCRLPAVEEEDCQTVYPRNLEVGDH